MGFESKLGNNTKVISTSLGKSSEIYRRNPDSYKSTNFNSSQKLRVMIHCGIISVTIRQDNFDTQEIVDPQSILVGFQRISATEEPSSDADSGNSGASDNVSTR